MTDAIQAAIDAAVTAERARIREGVQEWGGGDIDTDDVLNVIDEKPDPLTHEQIKGMSPEQVNARWPEIERALSAESGPTGQANTGGPLTREQIAAMSPAEQLARRDEVDEFLSGGGRNAA